MGFESVVSESAVKDPVGMIKMFDHFKNKNFSKIFESAEKIGIDSEKLFEATK
jgi:endo-1,4-beta-mannosidase